MDLAYSDTGVQLLCARFASLQRRLGERGARTAVAQLASLRAASSLAEFRHLPGRCRELDRGGPLALTLADGQRLVFEPADDPPPTNGDGALEWSAVRSVRILAIRNP